MLKVENLQVNYGGIQAVRGISFEVPDGEIVTLIGANGAGKSTTLRSIIGLVPPREGSVLYNGEELRGKSTAEIDARCITPVSAGRRRFPDGGKRLFQCGANAAITGDMLTTSGTSTAGDRAMFVQLGYQI